MIKKVENKECSLYIDSFLFPIQITIFKNYDFNIYIYIYI